MTGKNCDGIETEQKNWDCEYLDITEEQTMLERHNDDQQLFV